MKRVNISTRLPIRSVNPPITGRKNNIELSTQDIRACILSGAFVDEILPDGSTVRLSLSNYTKDNYVAKPEVKVETPVTVEEATAVEKVEEKEAEAAVNAAVADENEVVVSTNETVTAEDVTPDEKVEEKEAEAAVNISEEATTEQEQTVINTNTRNKRKNKR